MAGRKYSNETIKHVHERHRSGESMHLLCQEYEVNPSYFTRAFKKLGLSWERTHGRYNKNACFFENIDSEIKAYYLGLILSDGYVSWNGRKKMVGIRLNEEDGYVLEPLRQAICPRIKVTYFNLNYYTRKDGTTPRQARYEVTSNVLCDSLAQYGVVERKSYNDDVILPELATETLFRHFLRGFSDGDGSIRDTGGSKQWFVMSLSESFLKEIQGKLSFYAPHNLRFKLDRKTFDNHYHTQYYLRLNKRQDILWLACWLYNNASYGLVRKLNRFKEAAELALQYSSHRCNKGLESYANAVLTYSLKNE